MHVHEVVVKSSLIISIFLVHISYAPSSSYADDPKTHNRYDLWRMTMAELYKEYGLSEDTIEFIGHSLALHRDDAYLTQPAFFTVMKVSVESAVELWPYWNPWRRFNH